MLPILPIPEQPHVIDLWAPGEIDTTGWNQPEEMTTFENGLQVIRNVSRPTLTVYLPKPEAARGAGVVICPGGAYHFLSYMHEGIEVARWLNQQGIAAFILNYRLVQTGSDFPQCVWDHLNDENEMERLVTPLFPLITADGCQAVRLARSRASEWGLDPERIGILGFSAGGMVAFQAALHADDSSRPAFAAPIYSAQPPEAPIPPNAPPLFVLCAADDGMASPVCVQYFTAWRAAGLPAELHIFSQGGHGFGMNIQGLPSDGWIGLFTNWLQAQGLLA